MSGSTILVTTYSVREAAIKVGVSHVTVWRAVRDGKLAHRRNGRAITIFADDLLEYVLAHRGGMGIPTS